MALPVLTGALLVLPAQTRTPPKAPPAAPKPEAKAGAPERPVPFAVGETLTYDVSWSSYLSAGTATLSVKDRRTLSAAQSAYDIIGEVKPGSIVGKLYPFYYKAESFLDTRTLLPISASVYSDERGRTRTKTTTFSSPTSVDVEMKTATVVRARHAIAAFSQDPLSAMYILRVLALNPGLKEGLAIPITDGGTNYSLKIRAIAREPIKTGLGTLPALRITPAFTDAQGRPATARQLTLWISDDARHLPLRFDAGLAVGSFRLTLTAVSPK
jgi:hypothetical protein